MKTSILILCLVLSILTARSQTAAMEGPRSGATPTPKLPLTQRWHALCTEPRCLWAGEWHYSYQQAKQDADSHDRRHGRREVTTVVAE